MKRRFPHTCHSQELTREEVAFAISTGQVTILCIPKDPTRLRPRDAPSLPYWVVAKRPENVRPKEHRFEVSGPDEAIAAMEALGLELRRCGRWEGRYDLFYGPEYRAAMARLREAP